MSNAFLHSAQAACPSSLLGPTQSLGVRGTSPRRVWRVSVQPWSRATPLGRSQAGGSPGCCRVGFVLPFNRQQLRLPAQPLQIQRPFDCSGTVSSPQSMGLWDGPSFRSVTHRLLSTLPSCTSWQAPVELRLVAPYADVRPPAWETGILGFLSREKARGRSHCRVSP